MLTIIPVSEHYKTELDWLTSYHHFSFGEYYDPEKTSFGPLRVFNDDTIQPSKGFGFHHHENMEIVTYVIEGILEHKDNLGNHGIIEEGNVQRMTAGTGIVHSEYNHSKDKLLKLLQVWVFAEKKGLSPSWEQYRFAKNDRLNKLLPVVLPEKSVKSKGTLSIHQDASFYISYMGKESSIKHNLDDGRQAYLFVIDGKLDVNEKNMNTKDSAMIQNETELHIVAQKPTELILIDLPTQYKKNQ